MNFLLFFIILGETILKYMASLTPYSSVLGLRKAKHLLRRASYAYSKDDIDTFATKTPQQALDALVIPVTNVLASPYDPQPTASPDGFWTESTALPNTFTGHFRKRIYSTGWWWYNAQNNASLQYKMAMFLHTTFTVSKLDSTGTSTHFHDHIKLLSQFAFGNIKALAKKITFDNSMLKYLDNTNNNDNNPNENYAREFLELFTIGKGPQIAPGNYTNYTESDVQEAARVFSGIKYDNTRAIIDIDTSLPMGRVQLNKHDEGNKVFSSALGSTVIFGQTTEVGIKNELNLFVDMVFNQTETARAYCRKLYRFFVKSEWGADVETDIIEPLALDMVANGFEILPIVRKLLESRHFYDEDNTSNTDNIVGSIVKHPLQLLTEVTTFFNLEIPDPVTTPSYFYNSFYKTFMHNSFLSSSGFVFFAPDSVAGYPAHYQTPDFDRNWFVSNTIIARYKMIPSLISGRDKVITNANIRTKLELVDFVKDHMTNASNSTQLVIDFTNYLFPESVPTNRITYFENLLLDGYASYYWTGSWNNYLADNDDSIVKERLEALITGLINAPEFQLM